MKTVALSVLLVFLGLTLQAAEIVAEPFPPAQMTSLYIQKDEHGTTKTIQLAGETVVYQVSTGGKIIETVKVKPSGDDWFQFIQKLNEAKVYKWAPKYYYPGQGAAWVIDLSMEGRKFSSSGTNEFPKDGAEAQPMADPKAGESLAFQLFWQAALGLVRKAAATTPH